LCIHNFESSERIAFPIVVDKYTMLTITGGYLLAYKSNVNQLSFLSQIGENLTVFNSVIIYIYHPYNITVIFYRTIYIIYDADLITLGSNLNPQPLVKAYSFYNL